MRNQRLMLPVFLASVILLSRYAVAQVAARTVDRTTVSVEVIGLGKVKPNCNGRQFKVGSLLTLKAKPAKGYIWAGWTGAGAGEEQPCYDCNTFTVTPGLQLQANFVPNPFPPIAGEYVGVVTDTNAARPTTNGWFTLQLRRDGGLTGKLYLADHTYDIGGGGYREPVRPDGSVELSFWRGDIYDGDFRQVMVADLQFELQEQSGTLRGVLSDARKVRVQKQWISLPSEWQMELTGARVPP